MLVSTVEPLLSTKFDKSKKPVVYKLYEFTKGGTEIVDQKVGSCIAKSKSRKWTKVSFLYLLDTVRLNASTLFALAGGRDPKKLNSSDSAMKRAVELLMPFLISRQMKGLDKSNLQKVNLFTGNNVKKQSDSITVKYTSLVNLDNGTTFACRK